MPLATVRFTFHARQRLAARRISEDDVREVLASGEVIDIDSAEANRSRYLMLGWRTDRPLHVVAVDDHESNLTLVITAYEPGAREWDAAFRVRQL